MYQSDAEILFPTRVIPQLRTLRGVQWQQLVDRVISSEDGSIEKQAFTLMMIRLDGCLTCHADSYRAMRGCSQCAQQSIARFKGTDAELLEAFDRACEDMKHWHTTGEVPTGERLPVDAT